MTEACPQCGEQVFVAWRRGQQIVLDAAHSDDGLVSLTRDPDPHEPNPLSVVEFTRSAVVRGPRYLPHSCANSRPGSLRLARL